MDLDSLLWRFVKRYWAWKRDPGRIIHTHGTEYLLRTYLTPRRWPVSVFLHHFFRGDDDRELHNHPWEVSIGLILAGGYVEERLRTRGIRVRRFRPGSINVIRANDFHRVTLLDPARGCWTLFLTFRRVQDWGFLDRLTGKFIPWREHVERRDG